MIPCAVCRERIEELRKFSSARPAISTQIQDASHFKFVIDQPGFGPKIMSFFPNQEKFKIPCESCRREWSWSFHSRHEEQAVLKISQDASSKEQNSRSTSAFSDADRKREAKRTGRAVSKRPKFSTPRPVEQRATGKFEEPPVVHEKTPDPLALARELQNYVPQLFGLEETFQWGYQAALTWNSEGDLAKAFERENLDDAEPMYLIVQRSLRGKKWRFPWPETVQIQELKTANGTSLHVYSLTREQLPANRWQRVLEKFEATIVAPKKFRIFTKSAPGFVDVSKPF